MCYKHKEMRCHKLLNLLVTSQEKQNNENLIGYGNLFTTKCVNGLKLRLPHLFVQ